MNVEKSAVLPLRTKLRISRAGMAISLGFLNLRMDQFCGDVSKIHLPFRMADLNSALGDLQSEICHRCRGGFETPVPMDRAKACPERSRRDAHIVNRCFYDPP
jgi:hypothetical protein